MSKTINLRVHESLQDVLERIRKDVAIDMKNKYNLSEITVEGTLASQILAAKMRGQNVLHFKIRKSGLNKGILELL